MPKKRTRPNPANDAPRGKASSLFDQEEERIEEKRKQAFMPYRFFLKKGEGCEIVILDEDLEDAFSIREHNIQGSDGKWGNYERCLADTGAECPVCKKYGTNSYLVLFLTVIVKREWTSKKTGETHPYSKMLLPVKRGQFAKFRKLYNICKKQHGTMRGMMVYMERGTDDQSFTVGEPVPFEDDGSVFDFYTEDELVEEFGHAEIKSRKGDSVIKRENEDIEVYDYYDLFPDEDESSLRERHGVEPEAGSVEANEREFSEEDDIPMEHEGDAPNEIKTIAAKADEAGDDNNTALEALAEEHGLDYLDYGTWDELADELIEAGAVIPKPTKKAAKKTAKKSTRRTRKVRQTDDGGDQDGW